MSPESRPSSFVIAKLASKKTCSSLQERKVFVFRQNINIGRMMKIWHHNYNVVI